MNLQRRSLRYSGSVSLQKMRNRKQLASETEAILKSIMNLYVQRYIRREVHESHRRLFSGVKSAIPYL